MTKRESPQATQPQPNQKTSETPTNVYKAPAKDPNSIAELIKFMDSKPDGVDRSDVSTALNKAIHGLTSENRKDRVESIRSLKMMRKDIVDLSSQMEDNGEELVKSFDKLLDQTDKSNSLLKSYFKKDKEDDGENKQKGLVKGFVDGIYSESSPFLKLSVNLYKGVTSYIKTAKAEKEKNYKAIEEVAKSIDAVAGDMDSVEAPSSSIERVEPEEKAASAIPEPIAQETTIIKQEASPEEHKSKARKTYEKAMAKSSDSNATPVRRRGKDKVKRASRAKPTDLNPAVEKVKPSQDKHSDIVNKSEESSELQSSILKEILAAIDSQSKDDKAKTNPENTAVVLNKQLDRLSKVNDQLSQMIDFQKAQTAATEDRAHDDNKEELRVKAEKKALSKPSGGVDKVGKIDEQSKSSSILGSIIPEILGEIIGNKIGKGKGLLGGIWSITKSIGRGILGIFNPKNWISAVTKIGGALAALKNPKAMLSGILSAGSSALSLVKTGVQAAGGMLGKIGTVFKPFSGLIASVGSTLSTMASGVSKFLPSISGLGKLTKSIPIIGQVIAVAFAIWDFFKGFTNAGSILDKAEESLTLWDKVSAGLGSIVGGLVGILDSIAGLFGFETDLGETVKKETAKFLSELPTKVLDGITSLADYISKEAVDLGGKIYDGMKDTFLGAATSLLESIPGGKFIAEKLGLGKPAGQTDSSIQKAQPAVDLKKAAPATLAEVTPAAKPTAAFKQIDDRNTSDIKRLEEEKRKREEASAKVSQTNHVDNSVRTNVYQSVPLTTRNPDDSHRRGL